MNYDYIGGVKTVSIPLEAQMILGTKAGNRTSLMSNLYLIFHAFFVGCPHEP